MSGLVAALRCRICGAALGGLATDVVWICPPCGAAWEAETDAGGTRLVRRASFLLEPPPAAIAAARVVWLPFWRIELDSEVTDEPSAAGRRAADALTREAVAAVARRRVYVRAFWMRNAFTIGDPGLTLTAAEFPEVRIEGVPFPALTGIAIGSADAVRLAELFVLRIVDSARDVGGIRLHSNPASVHLVLVPFADLGDLLVCPATGHSFPRARLDDLPPSPPSPA